jgi:hypothetical protein
LARIPTIVITPSEDDVSKPMEGKPKEEDKESLHVVETDDKDVVTHMPPVPVSMSEETLAEVQVQSSAAKKIQERAESKKKFNLWTPFKNLFTKKA